MSKAAELAALIGSQSSLANRNIIINGNMAVAQRGTSATGLGASSAFGTVDRFKWNTGNSAGRFTWTQEAITDLEGFTSATKLACTTADTSIASNEYGYIIQKMEGLNLQRVQKGFSSAKALTLSFYVKGNASATYNVELYDTDNLRNITSSFAVTTSWVRQKITFPADTIGKFNNDNSQSLQLNFWLHAGSDYTGGTMQTSWDSITTNERALGSTSFFDSTDRTFFLTGVQLEVGEVATPFEHESYGDNLARCQRYFNKVDASHVNNARFAVAQMYSTGGGEFYYYPPVAMRTEPSLGQTGTAGDYAFYSGNATLECTGVPTIGSASSKECIMGFAYTSSATVGRAAALMADSTTSAYLEFNAEL